MLPSAILYTSATGHTRQYALLLGETLGLPVFSLKDAVNLIHDSRPAIYLGWIHASHVKGFSTARKHFTLCAVCGVGLCDTGTLTDQVRLATGIPDDIPLFTLQGGMDHSKLRGMDKLLISMLTKGLAGKKNPSPQDSRMLELLSRDGNYVDARNLSQVLKWHQMELG